MEENANGNTDVWWVANVSENGIDDLTLFWSEELAQAYAATSDDFETGSTEVLADNVAEQLIRDTMGALDRAEARDAEHSDRARYVTEQVATWIVNDGDHHATALHLAGADAAARATRYPLLRDMLVQRLRNAKEYTAAWHVAQELAPNDYARIHWADIADELLGE